MPPDTGNGNSPPTLGEVHRSQQRMERTLESLVQTLDSRFQTLAQEISTERHKLANFMAKDNLTKDFMRRVGITIDKVEQLEKEAAREQDIEEVKARIDAIEREEIAERAVKDFKKVLTGGKWLGALLGTGQLLLLAKAMGWI